MEKKNYKNGALYSIYGARKSKDGKRYNITLVRGKDAEREFATISLPKEKVETTIRDEKYIYIPVKLLLNDKPKEEKEDDLPF